jgi:hypothetical protein
MTDSEVLARSEGSTPSERYLAKLCDRSFLKFWSYPNVYFDKRKGGKGDGKELCDLLVVCGDHVLIFSDKTIGWQDGDNVELSWQRWFNRAIHHSARQIRKAERWICQAPEKIYIDKECTKPFPFPLPPPDRRKVHGIIVALGAGGACKAFFGEESSGSLMLKPAIQGEDHQKWDKVTPFVIGDVDPDGPFIHVLDDITLDIVMEELDTVIDFTAYLTKKAELFRSGSLISAGGEEELVAYYMTHMNADNEHDFMRPDGKPLSKNDFLTFAPGLYEELKLNPKYIGKRRADRDSYVWDHLIENFTDHMRAGTSITVDDQPFVLSDSEQAVRYMALESRFARRLYGKSILDVFERGRNKPRFTRWFLPGTHSQGRETAFFFTTLAVPTIDLPQGYEQYRAARRRVMETQAFALMRKHPTLRRVVGIATEPAVGKGSSEDIILVEDVVWTPELIERVEERQQLYGILQDKNLRETQLDELEFPSNPHPGSPRHRPAGTGTMNRKQRRALKAEHRRAR